MYRVDAGPVGILDSDSLEQQLESLRHQIALRWTHGDESFCQKCQRRSVWRDETRFSGRRPAREDALGFAVLPSLMAEAPFVVYGLKGNPLELRLSDLDWNTRGPGRAILRYTSGEPDYPLRALDLTQDADLSREPSEERMMAELRAIISLVLGCPSTEQRESYERRRNVHRFWNLDYVSRAPRRNVAIQIDGKHTEVELARWQEPHQLAIAHLTLDGLPAMAVSVGVSQVQLLGLLKSLVALRQDADALAEHDRDYRTSRPTSA